MLATVLASRLASASTVVSWPIFLGGFQNERFCFQASVVDVLHASFHRHATDGRTGRGSSLESIT